MTVIIDLPYETTPQAFPIAALIRGHTIFDVWLPQ